MEEHGHERGVRSRNEKVDGALVEDVEDVPGFVFAQDFMVSTSLRCMFQSRIQDEARAIARPCRVVPSMNAE